MHIRELYDHLLPYLPSVQTPLLDLQIRRTARDFFKRTTIWRDAVVVETEPGIRVYRLTPAEFRQTRPEVGSVLRVTRGSEQLPNIPEASRRYGQPNGRVCGWWSEVPGFIAFDPVPAERESLRVHVVLRPPLTAEYLPADLIKPYVEEFSAGVISALYSMPGKPWTQGNAAAAAARVYNGAVNSIRALVREGGRPNVSTMTPAVRFGT